ncbi:MAG: TraM recognition domain-containing protein, partial [Bacilli bacterium]
SANMPTFIYLQSLEGLNRLYGANAERLFLGSSTYKAVFRIEDMHTAEEFSKLIGKTETTYFSYSENIGQAMSNSDTQTYSTTTSHSESTNRDYIIEPAQFKEFSDMTCLISYKGSFGTLKMEKYWELFDIPIRIERAGPSEYLNYKKTAI